MSVSRRKSLGSNRPHPVLEKPSPGFVVLVEYKANAILNTELIAIGSARHAEAINEVAARPKELYLYCGCKARNLQGFGLRAFDEFHLLMVCMPNSKDKHAFDCIYYGGVLASDTKPLPSSDHHDKHWKVKFASPKAVLKTPPENPRKKDRTRKRTPKPNAPRKRNSQKHSTPVADLLHLMDAAGTNRFDPSVSDLQVNEPLRRFAEVLLPVVGDDGGEGAPQFVLGADADPMRAQLMDAIQETSTAYAPIVVVAELEGLENIDKKTRSMQFRGSDHEFRVSKDQLHYARRRSNSYAASAALSALSTGSSAMRVFLLMHVVKDEDGSLVAKRVGIVITNAQGIPVESSYELQMADHLVRTGRHFSKPLFRKDGYPYLHDFVLHDMAEPFFIEVNGMSHEAYVLAKQKSIAFLEEASPGRYLVWWALNEVLPIQSMPVVTAKNKRIP